MSTIFETSKFIDQVYQDFVFGYVRLMMEKQLHSNNIPQLIPYLILNYFFHGEYFAKYGEQVNVSDNKLCVTKEESITDDIYDTEFRDLHNTTYGNTWIDSSIPQIAKWTLSASVDYTEHSGVTLYFLSKDDKTDDFCGRKADEPFYGVNHDARRSATCSPYNETYLPEFYYEPWEDNFGKRLFDNQPFCIILNTKDKTICVEKSNDQKFTIYDDIQTGKNIRYKLGVRLFKKGDGVLLLDFDIDFD